MRLLKSFLSNIICIQILFIYLPNIVKTKLLNMLFVEKIKQLRESHQLPQRQLASILEIDTATYCKIERGDRKAKREQVITIANVLQANEKELLTLWLADQVYSVLKYEQNANEILNVVKENIVEYSNRRK